jgi:hypothetical protein
MSIVHSRRAFGWLLALHLLLCLPGRASEAKNFPNCDLGPRFKLEAAERSGQPFERQLKTAHGTSTLIVEDGYRILVSTQDRPFANVKAEIFNQDTFAADLKLSIDAIAFMTDDPKNGLQKKVARQQLNGLELYWIERSELKGGVLNITLVVDRSAHAITTIYLLNDEPELRSFKTLQEFDILRDIFWQSYTACVKNSSSKSK